jgi:SAM-dependent methyltransferase
VTATDRQIDFLRALDLPNLEVVRHDVRSDSFPERSFDLVHARAVLMHIAADDGLLLRLISWLRPDGWLLLEEPDFCFWLGDADPLWAARPEAWHRAFPSGSVSRGRWLLDRIPKTGLVDVGADAEVDIVAPRTPLAEFYRLSMQAIAPAAIAAGASTAEQAAAMIERASADDFFGCGFVHVGVWGRRPATRSGAV